MSEAFDRLRALAEQALEVPNEERTAWLRTHCPDDAALREAILELVSLSEERDTFLEPRSEPSTQAHGLPPGTEIDGFRIESLLGSGGMGSVFLARQDRPRRQVALKVLMGSLSSQSARDRFRYEVEVLGKLRHPGIAQIFDAGVHRDAVGSPEDLRWFAMEYVPDAATLVEHAKAEDLDVSARLALFLEVCEAVQHGHQSGIIHRDLKPDNLLVDPSGRVKVIDFGVARVLDARTLEATLRTQTDEIAGTLPYMSPEQVSGGAIDTRSDVYGLGVVLYQLLTGRLPIDLNRTDLITSARRIAEEPPIRPSGVVSALRGDLEAILLKALDKDPRRRYASAGALADDLRRHLAGEVVMARPPSVAYQMRLVARRNKALVFAVGAILGVAVAATIISVGYALDSREAERAAAAEAEEARKQRDRFELLFSTQFEQSMTSVGRHARDLLATLSGPPIAKRMLEDAIERLRALERISEGDPKVVEGLAAAHVGLAMAVSSPGNPAPGAEIDYLPSLERARSLIDGLLESGGPSRALEEERARILALLVAHQHSNPDEQKAARWRAEAVRLVAEAGLPVSMKRKLHWALGYAAPNPTDAEQHFSQELACLGEMDPATVMPKIHGRAYFARGTQRRLLRRYREAAEDMERARPYFEMMLLEPESEQMGKIMLGTIDLDIGDLQMALGDVDRAESFFEQGRQRFVELRAVAPGNYRVLWGTALAHRRTGQIHMARSLRDHEKGTPERKAGMEAALTSWTASLRVLEQIERSRRFLTHVRTELETIRRMMKMVRAAVDGTADGHGKASEGG